MSDSHVQSKFVDEAGHSVVVRTTHMPEERLQMMIIGPTERQPWVVSIDEARELSRQLAHMIRYAPKKAGKKKTPKGCEEDE